MLKPTVAAIKEAVRVISQSGLVVYPTDTVYGLGCNPFNEEAVKRIFTVKGRGTKPLPVLASDIRSVEKIAYLTDTALILAKKFWPGPLTLVLPKRPSLPSIVTCDLGSVAVRVPNHKVALELIRMSGGLLVGTSANKTGKKPPRTAKEAARKIGKEVDLIIDNGPTPIGASSTIVDLTREKLGVLRQGPIKLKDILSAQKIS
jgi:L-threonylcarbamoyladenylate synthase